jgi:D-galactarolactone isomerase
MRQSTPVLKAPPGATDTHMHIYTDGFAVAPTAIGPRPNGDAPDYLRKRQALGLTRCVVVQPTHYGTDNSCTLAAMAGFGATARGVAVLAPAAGDDEFERLTRLGVRGVRFQMVPGGCTDWSDTTALASRAAAHDWHAQLQLEGRELPERLATIRRWPGNLVVDHIGRFHEPGLDRPAVKALLDLVEGGRCWVKLSAPFIHSRAGWPGFEDVAPLARRLVALAPERMLWASNWPHPGMQADPPDDGRLLDILADWCPDEAVRRKILVDNPAALYGF